MAAIPYDTVYAFMNNRRARAGAFVSTGDALYSYGLKIAHDDPDGGIIIDLPSPYRASATTNIHLHACEGLRERSGRTIVKTGPGKWEVINPEEAS